MKYTCVTLTSPTLCNSTQVPVTIIATLMVFYHTSWAVRLAVASYRVRFDRASPTPTLWSVRHAQWCAALWQCCGMSPPTSRRPRKSLLTHVFAASRFGSCGGLSDTKAGDVAVATEGCISIYRNPAHWTTGEGEPYVITPPVPADSQLTELVRRLQPADACLLAHSNDAAVACMQLDERVTKAVGADRVVRGINVSADTFYGSQG